MITSTSNQKVKRLVQLNQKAKARKNEGVFIVEGPKMFLEAPIEWVREVYVSESFFEKCTIRNKITQYSYEIVSDDVFKKMSDTMTPQGILCVVSRPDYTLEQLTDKDCPLYVVLEDIQDPGNLGTIFRTAEGAGVDGIIMSRDTVDLFNPKVIRSTMGSIYRMPYLYTEHLADTMKELQSKGITIYAAHLKGKTFYDEESYQKGTAFLIGNEGNGLRDETADQADVYIKIPMEGKVESLNAAIATSLLMYEAQRQRRKTCDII